MILRCFEIFTQPNGNTNAGVTILASNDFYKTNTIFIQQHNFTVALNDFDAFGCNSKKSIACHIKSFPPDTLLASQAQLISRRLDFLRSVTNLTKASWNYEEKMESLLAEYEAVVDDAMKNNVDPVSQSFTPNWDYIQAVFFSTTILTTIGLTIKLRFCLWHTCTVVFMLMIFTE